MHHQMWFEVEICLDSGCLLLKVMLWAIGKETQLGSLWHCHCESNSALNWWLKSQNQTRQAVIPEGKIIYRLWINELIRIMQNVCTHLWFAIWASNLVVEDVFYAPILGTDLAGNIGRFKSVCHLNDYRRLGLPPTNGNHLIKGWC